MHIDNGGVIGYNIDMKKVNSYTNKLLALSIILSVMFVAGIPMIILGANGRIWAIMWVGIAFTAIGFYGTPIAWSVYGSAHTLKRIVYAVTHEHLYTVHEIAAQLSMRESNVRSQLDRCFAKNFLEGYKREGDAIVLNENVAAGKKQMFAECPYCGAKFTYTADDARCPYCRSPVRK